MNLAQLLEDNIKKYGAYELLRYVNVAADKEQVLTNEEIGKRARALAAALRSAGVKKDDVVASVVSNIAEVPQIINGIMRTGAAYLPIIFALTEKEIRYIIQDSGCKIIVTEDMLLEKVKKAGEGIASLEKIVNIGDGTGDNVTKYVQFVSGGKGSGDVEDLDGKSMAILMYTSGSTGTPKGVMLSHAGLLDNLRAGNLVQPFERTDVILISLPMNHIFGVLMLNECSVWGYKLLMQNTFNPRAVLNAIKKYKVTVTAVVPTMVAMVLQFFDPKTDDVSTLRYVGCSGAAIPQALVDQVGKVFGKPVATGYGLTEQGPTVSRTPVGKPIKLGSVGMPIPGVQVKIVDWAGKEVPRGESGEITTKGPGQMLGYWNKPKETAETLVDGWLHTGDLGRLDEEGELYIVGRKKDLIIKGGENIDPGVSEKCLYSHEAVLEAAVVAIPDPKYMEEVGAAVVLKPGKNVSEEDLVNHVREHVHHFFAPRRIFFLENLPKTGTGKILKPQIRAMLAEMMKKEG